MAWCGWACCGVVEWSGVELKGREGKGKEQNGMELGHTTSSEFVAKELKKGITTYRETKTRLFRKNIIL